MKKYLIKLSAILIAASMMVCVIPASAQDDIPEIYIQEQTAEPESSYDPPADDPIWDNQDVNTSNASLPDTNSSENMPGDVNAQTSPDVAEPDTEPVTDPATDTVPETETEIESTAETETEYENEAETETETETESSADSESEYEIEQEA